MKWNSATLVNGGFKNKIILEKIYDRICPEEFIMKNRNFVFLMLAATLVSFLVSVILWFGLGNKQEAIFVGIWVPSVLSFAILLQVSKE